MQEDGGVQRTGAPEGMKEICTTKDTKSTKGEGDYGREAHRRMVTPSTYGAR